MILLLSGLVLFFAAHGFTMWRPGRAAAIARLGFGGYRIAYSLVSLLGLVGIVWGFGLYRQGGWVQVWTPPVVLRHVALLLNLPIFVLFVAAYLPGKIKALVKHPMLLGVKIWAAVHLLANGDLGGMILFAAFLIWAGLARIAAKRRGDDPKLDARATPWSSNDWLALGIGLVLYVVVVTWFHPFVIGLSVLP